MFSLFDLLDNTTDSFCGSPSNQSVYVRTRFEYLLNSKKVSQITIVLRKKLF